MANPFLYEDILMEIFLRLPAKSVGKFRCLSKTWRTHLCTSQFINLHLSTRKTKQANLFLRRYDRSLLTGTLPIEDDTISSKLELPTTNFDVVDSCNGLVLLIHKQFEISLINPITLQHVKVPIPSRLKSTKVVESYMCGFGHDSSSNDYKIVMCYWCGVDLRTIFDVYSVNSKVWKTVNTSYEHLTRGANHKGVFTNGAIHWVSYSIDRPPRIVAFSLTDEVLYEIPSPTNARDWKRSYYQVHVLEGCLCVVDSSCILKKDIWIMKEYGVEDSWTKFTLISNGKWTIYRPLCFIGDEEIVLLTNGDRVIVYNLVEGTMKDMVVDGYSTFYLDGVSFFDSLVSI